MLHPFCWAGWAKARRGCFSGGNLGICFIGLLGLEVWSLFHLSPVSNFTLTLSYVVVALFVVVLIFGVSATFIKYHRLKRSGSGGVVGRDELKAVAGHWGVCLLFAGLVGIVGALMDSLSFVLPLFLMLLVCLFLYVWLRKRDFKAGVITVKAAYLVNIVLIVCIAVPVGVDAYVVVSTSHDRVVVRYQDASGNYHDSVQRNALVGQVREVRKDEGQVEYQWGEASIHGGNAVIPISSDSKDSRSRVEIVDDLQAGEAPYVVREVTIERFVGTRDDAPLCLGLDVQLRKSPDCTLGTINAKFHGTRSIIHIPAGSYTQYVKAS